MPSLYQPLKDATARPARVVIVSPALAAANNGNWRTSERWAGFLTSRYRVSIADHWPDASETDSPASILVALHARRSAAFVKQFAASKRPIALVLTGTDLYRDIQSDSAAQESLELADRLVLLQEHGINSLPGRLHHKTLVIEQSAPRLKPVAGESRTFDLALVGHLRDEKDPLTAARALTHLNTPGLRLLQIGASDQTSCGAQFIRLSHADSRIRCLGNLPHDATRALISRSQLLVLPSLMEGGANVLIEAIMSDVPALCSRISGTIGILGADYPGYFPVGDDHALAALIRRSHDEPAFLKLLTQACQRRAYLFTPDRERRKVLALISALIT